DANWQGHNPGNPLLAVVDPAVSRLYVSHYNAGGDWGLDSFDVGNPSQPNLVYELQYDTCGRQAADTLGVAFNPTNHDIYATFNGQSSNCAATNSGYASRWDQFGQNQL